jgi:AraC-like DNA-binding protein
MAVLIYFLYILIMEYYSGVEWINFNHSPKLLAWKDKVFPDYYVLDFACSNYIHWAMGNSPLKILHAPVAWWTWPGPHFRFGSHDNRPWDHYFAGFRGPRIQKWISSGLFPIHRDPPYIQIEDPETFRSGFESLIQILDSPERNSPRAVHILEGLLLALHEQKIERKADPMQALARQIWQMPRGPWNFHVLAREHALSYSHFRKIFREKAGLAPNQYLLKARIDYSAKLLRTTPDAVKTVADRAGFDEIYYFSKLFKKHFGIAPGQYRRTTLYL